MNRPTPQPGKIYRHYKGASYTVWTLAKAGVPVGDFERTQWHCTHTETAQTHALLLVHSETSSLKYFLDPPADETLVLYFNPKTPTEVWARPLRNFPELLSSGCKVFRFDWDATEPPSDLLSYLADQWNTGDFDLVFYKKESAEDIHEARSRHWDFASEIAVLKYPYADGGVVVLAKYRDQWGVCNHSNRQIVGALLGIRGEALRHAR